MSRNDSRPSPTLGELMSSATGGRKSEPIAAVFSFTPVSVIDTGLGYELPPIDIKSVQTTTDEIDPFPFNSAFQRYALALMEHNPNRPGRAVEYGLPTDRALTVLSDVRDTETFVQSNQQLRNISAGEAGSNVQPDVSVKDHPLETVPGNFDQSDLAKPGITNARSYKRPSHPIGGAVYDMLRAKNMYNPSNDSPYLNYVGEGEKAFSNGLWTFQDKLGEFDKDATSVTVLELREAAAKILSRAQSISESHAATMAKNIRQDSSNFTQDIVMLIPHATQIGLGKISFDNLRLRIQVGSQLLESDTQNDLLAVQSFESTLGLHPDPEGGGDFSHLMAAMTGDSFGTMNSPMEPFGGVLPFGMILPVFYFMIAVQLLGLISLPEVNREGIGPDVDPTSPWSMKLGDSDPGAYTFFERMARMYGFDVGGTGDKFFSSMILGMTSFFGVSQLPSPLGALTGFGSAFLNGLETLMYGPGYYLVAIKGCLRDLEQVTNAIMGLADISGVFSAIAGVFTLIEQVLSSYLMRFLALMVKLGRVVSKAYTGSFRPHKYRPVGQEAAPAVQAYTYRGGSTRVADIEGQGAQLSPLSLKTFSSGYIVDPVTIGMNMKLRTDENADEVSTKAFKSPGRISPQELEEIEKNIDKEFCPFSIHDVRTNEVISLPAFIETVNEDFAVNYSETVGYGRTDPIYTYSNTKRSINLTFHLVAMNKEDHDYMYYILNKLVMMLYPQRSSGFMRRVGNDQYFIQPFSQIPVASPVVRIKLGDLLKSNASTTAMRRIFGGIDILTTEAGTKATDISKKAHEAHKKRLDTITDMDKQLVAAREQFGQGTFLNKPFLIGEPGRIHMRVRGKYYKGVLQGPYRDLMPFVATKKETFDVPAKKEEKPPEGKAEQKEQKHFYVIKPDIPGCDPTTDAKTAHELFGNAAGYHVEMAKGEPSVLDQVGSLVSGGGLLPGGGIEYLLPVETKAVKIPAVDIPEGKPFAPVDSFLSPENNPIVHAFDNIKGEGLAGVITQFSLDYEGSTWGSGQSSGLRAPKHLKINLTFNPMHDMPLGIDFQGAIIGPSHPVGPYTKSRYDDAFDRLYAGNSNQKKKAQEVFAKELKNSAYKVMDEDQKEKYGKTQQSGMSLPF